MAEKTYVVCDICGAVLTKARDIYHIIAETDEYYEPDPAGGHGDYVRDRKELGVLCPACMAKLYFYMRKRREENEKGN